MTGGDGKYSVKFDANKDGQLDAVYFDNQKTANLFSECFINNSQSTTCTNWMSEQAKETTFDSDTVGVQLYRNGKKFGTIQQATWRAGMDVLHGMIYRLWKNFTNCSAGDKIDILSNAVKFSEGNVTEKEGMDLLRNIIVTANKPASTQKMNDAQIEALVDLIWANRFTPLTDDEQPVKYPFNFVDASFGIMQKDYFSDCSLDEGIYWAGCLFHPDYTLRRAELMEIHRLFGKFELEEQPWRNW